MTQAEANECLGSKQQFDARLFARAGIYRRPVSPGNVTEPTFVTLGFEQYYHGRFSQMELAEPATDHRDWNVRFRGRAHRLYNLVRRACAGIYQRT